MNWNILEKEIIKQCREAGKREATTERYVAYCKNLFEQGLPIVTSPEHLSMLIGLCHEYVCRMAYGSKYFYRVFQIPKSNGKLRTITEPLPDLKYVQRWILTHILEKVSISPYAKAFVKKRSVKENARFHKKQTLVVTLDIRDFFPSIHISDVTRMFSDLGYYKELSSFLAHLCCFQETLPQGAPTSPYLSNLRMRNFDQRIAEYTKSHNIRYTRYADDLTFSGNFDASHMICMVSQWIYEEGFSINPSKTHVARRNTRQEVTGIVVNSHLQVCKSDRKRIRQEVYYIGKFGLESHLAYIGETRQHYLEHLLGKINFACYVNPNDQEMKSYYEQISRLLQATRDV